MIIVFCIVSSLSSSDCIKSNQDTSVVPYLVPQQPILHPSSKCFEEGVRNRAGPKFFPSPVSSVSSSLCYTWTIIFSRHGEIRLP